MAVVRFMAILYCFYTALHSFYTVFMLKLSELTGEIDGEEFATWLISLAAQEAAVCFLLVFYLFCTVLYCFCVLKTTDLIGRGEGEAAVASKARAGHVHERDP